MASVSKISLHDSLRRFKLQRVFSSIHQKSWDTRLDVLQQQAEDCDAEMKRLCEADEFDVLGFTQVCRRKHDVSQAEFRVWDDYMVNTAGWRSQFDNIKRYFALGSIFEETERYSWDDLRDYYLAMGIGEPRAMNDDDLVLKGYFGCLVDFPCWRNACPISGNILRRWWASRRVKHFASYRKSVVCYLLKCDYLNLPMEEQLSVIRKLCFRFRRRRSTMLLDIEEFLGREGFEAKCVPENKCRR